MLLTTPSLILLILFALVHLADGYTTVRALKIPGRYEKTDALAWLMKKIGVIEALVLAKTTSVALVAWALMIVPTNPPPWDSISFLLNIALLLAIIFYAQVVDRNWKLGAPE